MDINRHDGRGDAHASGEKLSQIRLSCAEYQAKIAKMQQIQLTHNHLSDAIGDRRGLQDDFTAFNESFTNPRVCYPRVGTNLGHIRKNAKTLNDSIKQYQCMLEQDEKRYQVLNKASNLLVKGAKTEIERAVSNTKYNVILQSELSQIRLQNLNSLYILTSLHFANECCRAQSSIDDMRKNEKVLKDNIKEYQSLLSQEVLNKASTLLVKGANTEIEQAVSNTKYNAILQGELNRIRDQNQSLPTKLEQKNAKVKELTEIYDELIANAHP